MSLRRSLERAYLALTCSHPEGSLLFSAATVAEPRGPGHDAAACTVGLVVRCQRCGWARAGDLRAWVGQKARARILAQLGGRS